MPKGIEIIIKTKAKSEDIRIKKVMNFNFEIQKNIVREVSGMPEFPEVERMMILEREKKKLAFLLC